MLGNQNLEKKKHYWNQSLDEQQQKIIGIYEKLNFVF